MRKLQLNNVDVDVDNKTAIGITFQSYDVKSPRTRSVKASNSFSIPATAKNLQLFGQANNPQSLSTLIYEKGTLNYYINNDRIIKNASFRVDYITDRIGLYTYEKPDIWDILKGVLWTDFLADYLTWLQTYKGVPSQGAPHTGSYSDFISGLANNSDGIKLAHYLGNLYNYDPAEGENFIEDDFNIYLYYDNISEIGFGGHFSTYYKNIFEYIEHTYNVNFLTQEDGIIGNIWNDSYASVCYTPIRNYAPAVNVSNNVITGMYITNYISDASDVVGFLPFKKLQDKEGKTLYDCVLVFLQTFDIVIDSVSIDGIDSFRLARFDDLSTKASLVDWSGLAPKIPRFEPRIDGYAQRTYIKYSSVYAEGAATTAQRVLTCGNKNLDFEVDLFAIDAHIPATVKVNGGVSVDLSTEESFKTFEVLIDGSTFTGNIKYKHGLNVDAGDTLTASLSISAAGLYTVASEYLALDALLDAPRYYEVEKWLTMEDVRDLQFFKLYYFKELNGAFFINKISGFNPEKSNKPTKLELIKVSDKAPSNDIDSNYWIDGFGNRWLDGQGNKFY